MTRLLLAALMLVGACDWAAAQYVVRLPNGDVVCEGPEVCTSAAQVHESGGYPWSGKTLRSMGSGPSGMCAVDDKPWFECDPDHAVGEICSNIRTDETGVLATIDRKSGIDTIISRGVNVQTADAALYCRPLWYANSDPYSPYRSSYLLCGHKFCDGHVP